MNGEMQRCEYDGEPEEDECKSYEYSKTKKRCVFYEKDFWNHNGTGSICTAPPKKQEAKNENSQNTYHLH